MSELRNDPKQDRARASLERILVAAEEILDEVGPEATTTRAIADRAGLSVGSLYRFFPDKAAIVRELVRRYVEDMTKVPETLVPNVFELGIDDIEGVTSMLVHRSLGLHAQHPAWRKVRQWPYPDTGEIVSAPVRAAECAMVSGLIQALPYGIDARTADMIAETTSLALWPLIERAIDDPDRSEECADEAILLITSYVQARLAPFVATSKAD